MTAGRRDGRDLVLEVRVQPRASRSEFAGLHGDRVRVRLQAPPVDGRANAALVEFLAAAFPHEQIEGSLCGTDHSVDLAKPRKFFGHRQTSELQG